MDNPDQAYTGRRRTRRSNRRANGRADGRAGSRNGGQTDWQSDWQDIQTNLPPLTPLSADQLAAIHQASLQLLEDYGIEVMSADARAFPGGRCRCR
jgi:trimethylamine:corrinoid methyltransferase-like protein